MNYILIIIITISVITLLDNMVNANSLCDARGKVINVVSGDEFEIEFDENSDSSISYKAKNVKLANITVCDQSNAIETAKATLLNRYVCLKNIWQDAYGNITCNVYQMIDNSSIKKSFNSILVDIGYANLKKATENHKSEQDLRRDLYDNIEVIEPTQLVPIRNSSPTK